jgi:hypothetical protein
VQAAKAKDVPVVITLGLTPSWAINTRYQGSSTYCKNARGSLDQCYMPPVLGGVEGAGGYDPSTQNVLREAGFSVESVPEPRSSSFLALSLGCILWMRSSRCGLGNRIKRITGGEL